MSDLELHSLYNLLLTKLVTMCNITRYTYRNDVIKIHYYTSQIIYLEDCKAGEIYKLYSFGLKFNNKYLSKKGYKNTMLWKITNTISSPAERDKILSTFEHLIMLISSLYCVMRVK